MGLCDTIPGISGGTIAFITGIYQRLINCIQAFSPRLAGDIFMTLVGKGDKRKLGQDIKRLDLGFLITLLLGIGIAIILFSRVIEFLIDTYAPFLMAFFVGLIFASGIGIFEHIERHHTVNQIIALVGLAIGISLIFLIPQEVVPSLGYIFLGGFLAISAMLLPGISGAFVLLIMGIYSFMLHVLRDVLGNLSYILIFILGMAVGVFVMSRIIGFLFRKNKPATLYLLVGLVMGSLSVPIGIIYNNSSGFTLLTWIILAGLFILGVLFSFLITMISKEKKVAQNI